MNITRWKNSSSSLLRVDVTSFDGCSLGVADRDNGDRAADEDVSTPLVLAGEVGISILGLGGLWMLLLKDCLNAITFSA